MPQAFCLFSFRVTAAGEFASAKSDVVG